MTRERLVVVGNGMAGLRFLEEMQSAAADFDVTVVGAEPQPAYNRVLLSSLLAGDVGNDDVTLRPHTWYAERGITLLTGRPAVTLDCLERRLTLSGGETVGFDKLVLATGSLPIRLEMPGSALDGVMTFRDLSDVERLKAAAADGAPAVVIGGGLLGIEAAYGLARAGVDVVLVHIMPRLMERQLDAGGARVLHDALATKGIRVHLGTEVRTILGTDCVESVELTDGQRLDCGLVVMAVGVRADTGLARSSGLRTARGILVDDRLQTSTPGIYAIGDCAEHRGTCYGLVEPAYEQARIVASALTGGFETYAGSVAATNLKVSGVPVFSAGDFDGQGAEHIIVRDEITPAYHKLVIRDGRLAGVVLVGDTHDALWYADLIRSKASVATFRGALAFGQAFAEAA